MEEEEEASESESMDFVCDIIIHQEFMFWFGLM